MFGPTAVIRYSAKLSSDDACSKQYGSLLFRRALDFYPPSTFPPSTVLTSKFWMFAFVQPYLLAFVDSLPLILCCLLFLSHEISPTFFANAWFVVSVIVHSHFSHFSVGITVFSACSWLFVVIRKTCSCEVLSRYAQIFSSVVLFCCFSAFPDVALVYSLNNKLLAWPFHCQFFWVYSRSILSSTGS